MNTLRLALAQINPTVGALEENAEKITAFYERARSSMADLVVFPELGLCGYPPEDLLHRPAFVEDNYKILKGLAKQFPPHPAAIIGFAHPSRGKRYNAAGVLAHGRVCAVAHKQLLPNYGVFDEKRYFARARKPLLLQLSQTSVGVNICEDVWSAAGPTRTQCRAGAGLIINIAASPYHAGKSRLREDILRTRITENGVPMCMVNLVGGQDELVFDGGSFCLDADGEILARAPQFEEALLVFDVSCKTQTPSIPASNVIRKDVPWENASKRDEVKAVVHDAKDPYEEILCALVMGTRDYVTKNGFSKVLVGLSGGIDSSLVAVIAARALGPKNVEGISMPSRFSSDGSKSDAQRLAGNLGIGFRTIPIEGPFSSLLREFEPHFADCAWDLTEENIQARIRGIMLMALSNKFGWMVLATGNKSEMSVGYATLYGDMAGGFAVIKDIPKTTVYGLCRHVNAVSDTAVIPNSVLKKSPSAELRPGQKDSDALPEYAILDPILKAYVEEDMRAASIIDMGFDPETVLNVMRMVDLSEYKRRQAPPGVKITPRAFGRDRRMPVTQRYVSHRACPGADGSCKPVRMKDTAAGGDDSPAPGGHGA